jgi:hypothetical protein
MNSKAFRIIAALVMVASLLWGYWWLTWSLAIVFLFVFPSYYEILFWGIAYDALYGLPIPQFNNFQYVFSCASIALFLISIYLRKLLLAYEPTI